MKKKSFLFLICPLIVFGSIKTSASVDVYISDREKNALGLESSFDDGSAYISQLDCTNDIAFELTITISDEDTDDRDLYIFSGSNCDDSDDESDCDDDVIKLDAEDTIVEIPVSWILDDTSCSDSESTSVWVGLLEDDDEKDDNATWASSISFDLDGSPPEAPGNIFAEPGDEKLLVSFTYDEDDSFEGALLLYSAADQQTSPDGGVSDETADAGVTDDCTGALVEGGDVTEDVRYVEVSGGSVEEGYIRDLTNGVTYQIGVSAIDENGNLSPISEVICETPGETIGFLEEYIEAGGTTGEYCFIATAAFGDYDHPTVRILRSFRDRYLRSFRMGRQFVSFYYRVGPTLAEQIRSDGARRTVRALLTAFSVIASILIPIGPFGTACLALLVSACLMITLRRRY